MSCYEVVIYDATGAERERRLYPDKERVMDTVWAVWADNSADGPIAVDPIEIRGDGDERSLGPLFNPRATDAQVAAVRAVIAEAEQERFRAQHPNLTGLHVTDADGAVIATARRMAS